MSNPRVLWFVTKHTDEAKIIKNAVKNYLEHHGKYTVWVHYHPYSRAPKVAYCNANCFEVDDQFAADYLESHSSNA